MTDKLIDFRFSKNKSIVDFAKMIGISHSSYYKIETGLRNPSYNFLVKFKKCFPDANIDNIFFANQLDELSNY